MIKSETFGPMTQVSEVIGWIRKAHDEGKASYFTLNETQGLLPALTVTAEDYVFPVTVDHGFHICPGCGKRLEKMGVGIGSLEGVDYPAHFNEDAGEVELGATGDANRYDEVGAYNVPYCKNCYTNLDLDFDWE